MSLLERINKLSIAQKQLIAEKLLSSESSALRGNPVIKTHRLVAYVVADDLLPPTSDELKEMLGKSMPDYMVPQSFIFLDKIPLSPNGKVNINELPDIEPQRAERAANFSSAQNPVEEKLSKIWSSVLGMDLIGIHDNFFEIGGDSILSIQIIARAKNEGLYITPKQIFQNLTISELAKVAKMDELYQAEQGIVYPF